MNDLDWLGPLVWACLYVSDYVLAIACARMYQAQDKIVYEGSYEIAPAFQADVNARRRLSPRFVVSLLGSTAYLAALSFLCASWDFRGGYLFALGAALLIELTVQVRHLRNWFLFHSALGAGGIRGRIEYARGLLLRASALEILLFAVLYTIVFIVTWNVFVLGGATACAMLSLNHYRLARRHEAALLRPA